jgi:kinesin family protein 5
MAMVEIYNERIKDLLDPAKPNLRIRSNKKSGIYLENVTEKYILTEEEAFAYLRKGANNRAVTATNMNSQSSRSHMLFMLTLHTHDIYTGQAKSAKLVLVDLAGSEKVAKTGAEGKVLEEAKKINTSLTALGKVINALADERRTHIPYRDSKLTRLLQQSLGGNAITNLIVNVSPSVVNSSETVSSARFGQRAKSVKNDPVVNKSFTVDQLLQLLKRAEETIQKQNAIIKELQQKKRTGGYGAMTTIPQMMITMHLIDDETHNSQTSADSEDDSDEADSFLLEEDE